MMMKESTGSLKAYFIVIAILVLIQGLSTIALSVVNTIFAVIGLIGLAFAVAYFYIGFALRKLLVRAPNKIKYVIYANIVFAILSFLLSLLGGVRIVMVVMLIITLLIAWYLLRNVTRLTLEERSKSDTKSTA